MRLSSRLQFSVVSLFAICAFSTFIVGCAGGPTRIGNGLQGQVTASPELSPSERADRLFEILDVDGDGKLTKAEAQSGFKYLIASYDRDSSNEILAAKPVTGSKPEARKSKRRPTSQDANRAFEAMFLRDGRATEAVTKDEFKKLVVKANQNPGSDPFQVFYE